MRQRLGRVSVFLLMDALTWRFCKWGFFVQTPSLRAGIHFVSWRTLSRGHAHIGDFTEEHSLS